MLGEKIYMLRSQYNMSQGDLAEKMNVSRQSISKWETGTSVPELNKLILLSDMFNITIDELVNNKIEECKQECQEESTKIIENIEQKSFSVQKVIAFILFGFGLLCCLFSFLFGIGYLVIGSYFITCSIICLLVRKYAFLIIAWGTIILLFLSLPFITGNQIFAMFNINFYRNGITASKIIAITLWIVLAILIFRTIRALKKN